MPKVSTLRKISIAGQIASRRIGATRVGGALVSGVRTSFQSISRVLHHLWLEVTGFTFLVMAIIGGVAGFREYAKYQAGEAELGRVILAACFTVTFAWFGITSFWRVRKKS